MQTETVIEKCQTCKELTKQSRLLNNKVADLRSREKHLQEVIEALEASKM